jgi:hypothetical protein
LLVYSLQVCLIVDPGLAKAFQIPTYKVTEKSNYCRHWAANSLEESAAPPPKSTSWFFGSQAETKETKKPNTYAGDTDGLWVYCYPNTGINCYEPAWYSMRVIPLEKNKTRLEYEIFAKKGVEESKIQEFIKFLKEVEKEVIPFVMS